MSKVVPFKTANINSKFDETKSMRKDFGLTRKEAAFAMGVTINVVENWERGFSSHPSMIELEKSYRNFSVSNKEPEEVNLLFGFYPLRMARHFLGISVENMAKQNGFSKGSWLKHEANYSVLDREVLMRIECEVQNFFASVCDEVVE